MFDEPAFNGLLRRLKSHYRRGDHKGITETEERLRAVLDDGQRALHELAGGDATTLPLVHDQAAALLRAARSEADILRQLLAQTWGRWITEGSLEVRLAWIKQRASVVRAITPDVTFADEAWEPELERGTRVLRRRAARNSLAALVMRLDSEPEREPRAGERLDFEVELVVLTPDRVTLRYQGRDPYRPSHTPRGLALRITADRDLENRGRFTVTAIKTLRGDR